MMDKLKLSWIRYRESLIILVRKYYANGSVNLSPYIDIYFKRSAPRVIWARFGSEKTSAVKFRLPL